MLKRAFVKTAFTSLAVFALTLVIASSDARADCCSAVVRSTAQYGDDHYSALWQCRGDFISYWNNTYDLDEWSSGWGNSTSRICNNFYPLQRMYNGLWALRYSSPDWEWGIDPTYFKVNLLTWISNYFREIDDIDAKCSGSGTCHNKRATTTCADDDMDIFLPGLYDNLGTVNENSFGPYVSLRAGLLAHEARHAHCHNSTNSNPFNPFGWGSPHNGSCPRVPQCDVSFYDYGAYAYEVFFLGQYYAFGELAPNRLRSEARKKANSLLRNRFENDPGIFIPEHRGRCYYPTDNGGCYVRTPR